MPDRTTLARHRRSVSIDMGESRRQGPMDIVLDSTVLKFIGPGEWALAKHGEKRRSWRKLHVAVDPVRGEIVAHALTDDDTNNISQAVGLIGRSGGRIRTVLAACACDGAPAYSAIRAARPAKSPPKIAFPPQPQSIRAVDRPHGGTEGERHAGEIATHGRMAWQKRNRYSRRALGEIAIGRVKRLTGGRLHTHAFGPQRKESAIAIRVANLQIAAAKPSIVRVDEAQGYRRGPTAGLNAPRPVRTGATHATQTMIDRGHQRFDLCPALLVADMAYGSAEVLGWLVEERGGEPHNPVIDKSTRTDGTFSREDFVYDHGEDAYIYPAGK